MTSLRDIEIKPGLLVAIKRPLFAGPALRIIVKAADQSLTPGVWLVARIDPHSGRFRFSRAGEDFIRDYYCLPCELERPL